MYNLIEELTELGYQFSNDMEFGKKVRLFTTEFERKDNMKIITLCGSTKFKNEFEEENKRLTLEGNLVISVGAFGHSGDIITEEQKVMLDDLHKRKIDLADEIFVINVNGYIGKSTKSEIEYALKVGKTVKYLE